MRSGRTEPVDPLARVARFAAALREHGFVVGIAEQQAMVRAALALPLDRAARIESAWRAIACHGERDWRRWPELFERYWHPERVRGTTRMSGRSRPSRGDLRRMVEDLHRKIDGDLASARSADTALQAPAPDAGDPGLARARGGASRADPLHDRSLSQWLPQDLGRLNAAVERIVRALRRRLTRRWRDAPTGRWLDLRRTLHRGLRTGGEPVKPAWRRRRRRPPRLFLLVDVSRSMEAHAQFFLRVARAFVAAANARVFVFHTRLAEVTPLLRSDSPTVQEKVNAVTAGFGGGTRIAASLDDFRVAHARAQLGRGARVWVLSDGFDADPPEHLRAALGRLRARGARLSWIHPGARPPASEAMRLAMQARLLDRVERLDNLADLERLALRIDLTGSPP